MNNISINLLYGTTAVLDKLFCCENSSWLVLVVVSKKLNTENLAHWYGPFNLSLKMGFSTLLNISQCFLASLTRLIYFAICSSQV